MDGGLPQRLNSFTSLAVTFYCRTIFLIIRCIKVTCCTKLNTDCCSCKIIFGFNFLSCGYASCHRNYHNRTKCKSCKSLLIFHLSSSSHPKV